MNSDGYSYTITNKIVRLFATGLARFGSTAKSPKLPLQKKLIVSYLFYFYSNMSKAEDYLIIIDGTFAKVTSLGKNYICKLEARKAKLKVSCACLDDKELWTTNCSLDALDKQV